MRYGFDLKIEVLNSLKNLSNEEAKGYTVSEVFEYLLKSNDFNPSKSYRKSFRKRVWKSLKEWVKVGWVEYREEKHKITKAPEGYYQYAKQQSATGPGSTNQS